MEKQNLTCGTLRTGREKAGNLTVAYIGGGSRGWAWGFMKDLAMDPDLCGTVRLYDTDRPAAERNRIIGQKISAHPDAVSRWEYEVSGSLQDALTGADFVVISILPATNSLKLSVEAGVTHIERRYHPVTIALVPASWNRPISAIQHAASKKTRRTYFPFVISQLFLQALLKLVSSSSIIAGIENIRRR